MDILHKTIMNISRTHMTITLAGYPGGLAHTDFSTVHIELGKGTSQTHVTHVILCVSDHTCSHAGT